MTKVDQEIIGHMADPRNYGTMEDPDATGIGENPENGEKVIIQLKVDEQAGGPTIEEIRFQAIGCMTTVVAGSIITSEARGLDFDRSREMVSVALGMLEGVPPEEAACTEMVALALQAALDTYEAKRNDPTIPALIYRIENSCAAADEPSEGIEKEARG